MLSLLTLFVTTILHACFFLAPLLSLTLNATVLLLIIVGYGLLTWNIYGTPRPQLQPRELGDHRRYDDLPHIQSVL